MSDMFDLTGKVAIVTGGNGGIGRAIAVGLAQHGADIVVAARNEQKTAVVVKEIEALGRRCIGVRCDVLEQDDILNTVDRAVRELGGLNILVNNAGIAPGGEPTPDRGPGDLASGHRYQPDLGAPVLSGGSPDAGESRWGQNHQYWVGLFPDSRCRWCALFGEQGRYVEPDAGDGPGLGSR